VIDLLQKDELKALTGEARPKGMIQWLAEYEWSFEVGSDGFPRVDRRYYDMRMLGYAPEVEQLPNLKALRVICAPKT
jgi:hypothetical protein